MTEWSLDGLATRHLGPRLEFHAAIGSTSDRAFELGQPGTVVLADCQTAGRGRHGRRWESPAGRGLWFSVLLAPALPLERAGALSIVAALGVAEGVEQQTGLVPEIHWPNDLLAGGRKFAGVLVETRGGGGYVVGIGIDVNQAADDFPRELRRTATSLRLATGRELDRPALLCAVVRGLDRWYDRLRAGDHEEIESAWTARCTQLGRRIVLREGGRAHEGIARRFSLFEGIELELEGGERRTFRNEYCVIE